NFQCWDPVSRILLSGDLGVSMGPWLDARKPVTSLAAPIPKREAVHRRHMLSNKVLRLWANTAPRLPRPMIGPRRGAPMARAAGQEFVDWIGTVDCGVDHLTQANYAVPA